MKDIFKLCFKDVEASTEKLDEVIEALHSIGSIFWEHGSEYQFFSDNTPTCTSWLERDDNGNIDLNGMGQVSRGMTVIPFDEWFALAMETIKYEQGEMND